MCSKQIEENCKLITPLDRNERNQIMTDFDLLHTTIMGTLEDFFSDDKRK